MAEGFQLVFPVRSRAVSMLCDFLRCNPPTKTCIPSGDSEKKQGSNGGLTSTSARLRFPVTTALGQIRRIVWYFLRTTMQFRNPWVSRLQALNRVRDGHRKARLIAQLRPVQRPQKNWPQHRQGMGGGMKPMLPQFQLLILYSMCPACVEKREANDVTLFYGTVNVEQSSASH